MRAGVGADRAARAAVAVLTALMLGAVQAHAYLTHVEPGQDGVLTTVPSELTLHFSMGVEPRFSTFEVHRLEIPDHALPADPSAPSERELQRLNALAAQLAARVLAGEGGDDPMARFDDGDPVVSERSTVVTLGVRDDLANGIYVVVWEVLAFDSHWTSGHQLLLVAASID